MTWYYPSSPVLNSTSRAVWQTRFALSGRSQCFRPVSGCDVKDPRYLQMEAEVPLGIIADTWDSDGASSHLLPTKNHM